MEKRWLSPFLRGCQCLAQHGHPLTDAASHCSRGCGCLWQPRLPLISLLSCFQAGSGWERWEEASLGVFLKAGTEMGQDEEDSV